MIVFTLEKIYRRRVRMTKPRSIRASDEAWEKIKENAERSNMSTNSYIIGCSTSQRVPYKHKRQEIARLYVELAQCCNDSPEINRVIGGNVCQLREYL